MARNFVLMESSLSRKGYCVKLQLEIKYAFVSNSSDTFIMRKDLVELSMLYE